VEAAAREQRIGSLFTEASELARRLFERKGFAVVERQDLVVRGVAIHNYRMAKALDLPPASDLGQGRTADLPLFGLWCPSLYTSERRSIAMTVTVRRSSSMR
jgi:hypothetical protein